MSSVWLILGSREHIDRAHLREPRTCPHANCPGFGRNLWRAVLKGKSDEDKKRLSNDCPHDRLDERDYVWKDDFRRICKAADEAKVMKRDRWEFIFRGLFDWPANEHVPDPCELQPKVFGWTHFVFRDRKSVV